MFKYKDLRMLVISILLELTCIFTAIYFMHEKIKCIIALFLALTLLPTFVVRFNAKIFDDSMIVYVFKGIGILPEMIEFQDIKDYQLVSKHQIIIHHKKASKLCIINAQAFYVKLDRQYKQYLSKL